MTMTEEALLALAVRVASEPSLWRPLLRHDPVSRWHVRLARARDHDVWLLGWTTGQAVALHDHGNSAGAFVVVQGVLVEAHLGSGGELRHARLPAGAAHAFPARYIHNVSNPGSTPAASIHVYSPPLSTMTFYERSPGTGLHPARTDRFDGIEPPGGIHAVS